MMNRRDQSGADALPARTDDIARPSAPMLADSHEARLRRASHYQATALAKADSLEANLGSINSGLIRIALWLDETIEQAIQSAPRTVERLQHILPAIDTHLRVTRQVDRFAQLEIRATEARNPKTTGGARKARPTNNSADAVVQSEDFAF